MTSNKILVSLIVIVFVLSGIYFYINLADENRPNMTQKDEVAVAMFSFDELPENERDKYVKKEELDAYGKFLTPKSYAMNFDIDNMDEPISENINELRVQVRTLRAQNKLLYDDNVDLVAKNLDIAQMFDSQKESSQNQIDELTAQNTKNSEQFNSKILSLQENLENVQKELEKKQDDFENLYRQTQENLALATKNTAQLEQEREALMNEVSLKNSEIQNLSNQRNTDISNMQKEHEAHMVAIKTQIEAQKYEYESQINAKQSEIISLKNEHNKTIEFLQEDIKNRTEKFQKDIAKAWNIYQLEVSKLNSKIEDMEKKSKQTEENLRNSLDELKRENLKKDERIKRDEENLTKLVKQIEEQTKRLDNEIQINKKYGQNHTILNDKITSLINSNMEASKDYQTRISQLQNSLRDSQKTVNDLNASIAKKDQMIKRQNEDFDKFKKDSITQIESEKSEKNKLTDKNKELEKLANIGKNSGDIKMDLETANARLLGMMSRVEYLENENENLKKIIQLNFKTEVPKKVVLIASIECDDMSVGSDTPTAICKHRVSEFLQRYNSNYIFEITPIVSKGNFIATSKAAQVIPKNELEKINAYANFGIGKERAKTAGELVKDEFGEFSRISYSNEIITSSNKQGFVIKVYR